MHHIPSQEQGHLPRGRGSGRGPSGSGSGSSGSGDTGGRLTRWRDYQLRRATTSPLLPSAASFGPNTGTAQPQLTCHAPPHTCRYWGSRMDPDCVFSCLLRAAVSPTPPPAWLARFSPDRFAYRSASTRRILHS